MSGGGDDDSDDIDAYMDPSLVQMAKKADSRSRSGSVEKRSSIFTSFMVKEKKPKKSDTLEFAFDPMTGKILEEEWEIIFKLGVLKYKEQEYRREQEAAGSKNPQEYRRELEASSEVGPGENHSRHKKNHQSGDALEVQALRKAQKVLEDRRFASEYSGLHDKLERVPGIIGNLLMDERHSQLRWIVEEKNYPLELLWIHYERHAVRCWDILSTLINNKDDALYWNVLQLVMMRTPSVVGLKLLEGNPVPSSKSPVNIVNYEPKELDGITEYLVMGSRSPIATCLRCADLYKRKSEIHLATCDDYVELQSKYTELAIGLLDNVESEHGAALILEAPSEGDFPYTGPSALQIAVETENFAFLSNSRIVRVVSTMWWHPKYLHADDCDFGVEPDDLMYLMLNPRTFYRSPIGKFSTRTAGFLTYIIYFSWLTAKRPCIYDPSSTSELVFWLMNCGFVSSEAVTIYKVGPGAYAADAQNTQDALISFLFVVLAFLRATATGHSQQDCAATMDDTYPILYSTAWVMCVILMWARITFLFVMDDKLGPLYRMLTKMMDDIRNFICIMTLFFCGFMLGFYYFVGDLIGEFNTVSRAMIEMFSLTVGVINWEIFAEKEDGVEVLPAKVSFFAMLLLFLYVVISFVIMLNLLIAMMAKTFMQVYEESKVEFTAGRGKTILELYNTDCLMPPPFNVFVYLTYGPFAIYHVTHAGYKAAKSLVSATKDRKWICGFCHSQNRDSESDTTLLQYLCKLKKKDLISTEDMTDVINSKVIICKVCSRVAKEIPKSIQAMEQISLIVYILIVWPVHLATLALVPWVMRFLSILMPPKADSSKVIVTEQHQQSVYVDSKGIDDSKEAVLKRSMADRRADAMADTRDRVRRVFEDMKNISEADIYFRLKKVHQTLQKLQLNLMAKQEEVDAEANPGMKITRTSSLRIITGMEEKVDDTINEEPGMEAGETDQMS